MITLVSNVERAAFQSHIGTWWTREDPHLWPGRMTNVALSDGVVIASIKVTSVTPPKPGSEPEWSRPNESWWRIDYDLIWMK